MAAVLIGGAAGKAGRILDRAVEALCARANSVANPCNIFCGCTRCVVHSYDSFRPNVFILGFMRPICVDNGITGLENQCARSDGESVSGCQIRERV